MNKMTFSRLIILAISILVISNPASAQQNSTGSKNSFAPILTADYVDGLKKRVGKDKMTALMQAVDVYKATAPNAIAKIDELIKNAGQDPLVAQEKVNIVVDTVLQPLSKVEYVLKTQKITSGLFHVWLVQQEKSWQTTRRAAGRYAYMMAVFNDTLDTWENNWVPQLKKKKEKFRETGKDISDDYNDLFAMYQKGTFDASFDKKVTDFKTTVYASKTLQRSLLKLREHVSELKEGDPGGDLKTLMLEPTVIMASARANVAADSSWMYYMSVWNKVISDRWLEVVNMHALLMKETKSLREQKLFREHGKPLKGLEYKQIHPTFRDFYEDMISRTGDHKRKVAAEEKRWQEDKKIIDQHYEECGLIADREERLKNARAVPVDEEREFRLKASRGMMSADKVRERRLKYARLMDKNAKDAFYEKYKGSGKTDAEIEKEWEKYLVQISKEEEAEVAAAKTHDEKFTQEGRAALDRRIEEGDRVYTKWKNECDAKEKDVIKIWSDNIKRRKELGLPIKPLKYGRNPDWVK